MNILYILLIATGLLGLSLSSFIRYKKTRKKKMVCYVGQDCDKVVNSEYSKFLGFPVEFLGMLYYAMIVIAYTVFLLNPAIGEAGSSDVVFWVLSATTGALLFSFYLIFIQGFVLKEWCEWCLTSASLCIAIFIMAIINMPSGLVEFLRDIQVSLLIIYSLSIALGVGTATITNVLFFKFLKDLKISDDEVDILKTVSQITWLALAGLIISGAGLYISESMYIVESSIFIMMSVVVGVIIVAEAFLNLWIGPRLVTVSFDKEHEQLPREISRVRKLAFALGAISMFSWYSILILKSVHQVAIPFIVLFALYSGVVILALVMGHVADHSLSSDSH